MKRTISFLFVWLALYGMAPKTAGGYTLTMAVNPAGAGTTVPAIGAYSGYALGTVVNITATPAAGYRFFMWDGEVANSYNSSTTVTMTANKTVRAMFIKRWTITLNINPPGTGTWSNDGGDVPVGSYVFDQGQYLHYNVHPATGYFFVQWTGDLSNGSVPNDPFAPSHSFQTDIDRDWTITANFAPIRTLTLNVNPPAGGGTFPGSPYQWPDGYAVDIWAEPNPGYVFLGWTGDVAAVVDPNQAHTSIMMAGDKTVTANFAWLTVLTMQASPPGGGTTTPSVGTHNYNQGTVVNITATPAAGYRFGQWDISSGVADPSNPSTTVTMTGYRTVRAIFIKRWTITLNVNPPGSGNWSNDAGNVPVGSYVFDQEQYLHYNARPATGYMFVQWTGDRSSSTVPDDPYASSHSFETEIDRDWTLTANFAPIRTLTINLNPPAGGGTFPGSPYQWPDGYAVDIWAEPNTGYVFLNWTGDVASVTDPNQAHTSILMTGNRTVTANFSNASSVKVLGLPLPKTCALSQNYPNPFNPETKIRCELPQPGSVMISVYSPTGRIVRMLVNRQMAAGTYEVNWNGRDDDGNPLPTGIYFCRMRTGNVVFIKKMALMK
jgi:uncharacterized repeat protein (TIGR02543 family)